MQKGLDTNGSACRFDATSCHSTAPAQTNRLLARSRRQGRRRLGPAGATKSCAERWTPCHARRVRAGEWPRWGSCSKHNLDQAAQPRFSCQL